MIDVSITNEDIDAMEAEHNALFTRPHEQWKFDDKRRHVISSWDDVQACPGSGKTTLVAAKLLILAKKWTETNRGVCVLTHTNVARDEIVDRLHDHPSGFKLTTYPHFIGTIQQFVNTFLGLPYCRSKKFPATMIDDDACVQALSKYVSYGTKAYLDKKRASLYALRFNIADGSLSVPGFKKESDSKTYKDLESAKIKIIESGLFFFSEMYVFGNDLLSQSPDLAETLRKRFPLILMDEMQDTQKFQDTLLNKIFEDGSVRLQRLGDPDQAIFDNIGEDGPNESYNGQDQPHKIKTTHRFGLDICEKIIGLSYNKLDELSSARNADRGEHPHTIFLYDNASREQVLEAFGNLVAQTDPANTWDTVKAVGGVEGEGGHISKYWPKFDKNKSVSNPKPEKLIHIAHFCKEQTKGHVGPSYGLLMQGVLELLRKANLKMKNEKGKDTFFSRQPLMTWLKKKGKHEQFRKLLSLIVLGTDLGAKRWALYVAALKKILEIDALPADANEYLAHDEAPEAEGDEHAPATNVFVCANGRKIEVGTIHSVKGETHDATLILETKLHEDDVKKMLPHIIDASENKPTTDRKKAFMRKLYVASSRPRHLLCIALHRNNISDMQIEQLIEREWLVSSVPRPDYLFKEI